MSYQPSYYKMRVKLFSVRNNDDVILRIYIQSFTSILCDEHDILDTNADAFIIDVDSRLYREALTYFDDFVIYK